MDLYALAQSPATRAAAVSGNSAPSMTLPSSVAVSEGEQFGIPYEVTDADPGDQIRLTASGLGASRLALSASLGMERVSGVISGELSYFDAGIHTISLEASDGTNPPVKRSVLLTVADVSPAPLSSPSSIAFRPERMLEGPWTLPSYHAWSPSGDLICLRGPDGMYLLDVLDPSSVPRKILPIPTPYARWSPAGDWCLFRTQSESERRDGLASLVAVAAAGGEPVSLLESTDIGPFVWGKGDEIFYWSKRTGARSRIGAPQGLSGMSRRDADRCLVWDRGGDSTRGELILFDPQVAETETIIERLSDPQVQPIGTIAALPDQSRYLVRVFWVTGSVTTEVLDTATGRIAKSWEDSGDLGFAGTSVSSDGRYIAGYREHNDGRSILKADLLIADPDGRWIVPVRLGADVNAVEPQVSRLGGRVAFRDPVGGALHVGRLEFSE